jgi:hypothetical protein
MLEIEVSQVVQAFRSGKVLFICMQSQSHLSTEESIEITIQACFSEPVGFAWPNQIFGFFSSAISQPCGGETQKRQPNPMSGQAAASRIDYPETSTSYALPSRHSEFIAASAKSGLHCQLI